MKIKKGMIFHSGNLGRDVKAVPGNCENGDYCVFQYNQFNCTCEDAWIVCNNKTNPGKFVFQ